MAFAAWAMLLPCATLAQDRLPPTAPPEAQIFDPLSLKTNVGGPVSDVLVLASAHLAQLDPAPSVALLDPLMQRLEAYQPGLIAVEGVSGPDCDALARLDPLTPGVAADYCWPLDAARAATGLDVAQATLAAATMLRDWPASPTAARRRRLAATFIAAGDRPSAVVQWLHLAPAERVAGDGLDAALTEILTTTAASRNERIAIAARLAVRLGLQRVYLIDDHSADSILRDLGSDGEAAIQAIWNRQDPFDAENNRQIAAATTPDGILGFFRWMNLPATQAAYLANDHAANMAEATPPYFGRRYGMWWEARNLRMVANLRVAMADQPGVRVLVVVGASHKPHMDAYLNLMHDITTVDAAAVLR
jgi:Family of unknown function (DUF5694)